MVRNIQEDDNEVQVYSECVVQGTNGGNWDKIWYISKFYSKHMTPNRDLFLRFKPCFDPVTQELDTHFIVSNGVGEIMLETSETKLLILCMAYVPEIGLNILSMKQLINQGFEISLDGTTCTIKYMFPDEESTTNNVEKTGLKDVLTGETIQKKDVEIISNYWGILLGNDKKIVKDDNLVEVKQDGTLGEKDDAYKGWSEKKFIRICERYKITKKRCENC